MIILFIFIGLLTCSCATHLPSDVKAQWEKNKKEWSANEWSAKETTEVEKITNGRNKVRQNANKTPAASTVNKTYNETVSETARKKPLNGIHTNQQSNIESKSRTKDVSTEW
jgi:hypothetical protein